MRRNPCGNVAICKEADGCVGAAAASSGRTRTGNNGGLWRFYTEDSTGLKIGPVPVLVMSLVFIASVFVLHIWGKFTRSRA
ncbi:unnamed protein product [Heligmosomoides polygyrus]|uniref:Protein transport protein Sec61 subunit beta n=1 Tax=Heligmosomoides polygyrus TaxID=6339 RepID=A0A183G642_HELPZ|nr:unnamed protein product [Heligmosomoides polygyrus]